MKLSVLFVVETSVVETSVVEMSPPLLLVLCSLGGVVIMDNGLSPFVRQSHHALRALTISRALLSSIGLTPLLWFLGPLLWPHCPLLLWTLGPLFWTLCPLFCGSLLFATLVGLLELLSLHSLGLLLAL